MSCPQCGRSHTAQFVILVTLITTMLTTVFWVRETERHKAGSMMDHSARSTPTHLPRRGQKPRPANADVDAREECENRIRVLEDQVTMLEELLLEKYEPSQQPQVATSPLTGWTAIEHEEVQGYIESVRTRWREQPPDPEGYDIPARRIEVEDYLTNRFGPDALDKLRACLRSKLAEFWPPPTGNRGKDWIEGEAPFAKEYPLEHFLAKLLGER